MSVYNMLSVYLSAVGWGKWIGLLSGGRERQSFSCAAWGSRHSSSWAICVMYFFVWMSVRPFLYVAKGRVKACAEVTHTEFCFSRINRLTKKLLLSAVYVCLWLSMEAEHISPEQKCTCIDWMHSLALTHTECLEVLFFFLSARLFRFWN